MKVKLHYDYTTVGVGKVTIHLFQNIIHETTQKANWMEILLGMSEKFSSDYVFIREPDSIRFHALNDEKKRFIEDKVQPHNIDLHELDWEKNIPLAMEITRNVEK